MEHRVNIEHEADIMILKENNDGSLELYSQTKLPSTKTNVELPFQLKPAFLAQFLTRKFLNVLPEKQLLHRNVKIVLIRILMTMILNP